MKLIKMTGRICSLIILCLMGISTSLGQQNASTSYDHFAKMKTDHWTIFTRGFYSIGETGREPLGSYIDENGNIVGLPGTADKYWGVSLTAQRKFYFSQGWWAAPEGGLLLSWPRESSNHPTELGVELSGLVGYTLTKNSCWGVDFFAGMTAKLGLMKHQAYRCRYWPGAGFARFGVSVMRGHISLTAAFNLAVCGYRHFSGKSDYRDRLDAFDFGIGYSF